MNRKIFALLIVLIASGIGGFVWFAQSQSRSSIGTSELSTRASEFISQEKGRGAGTWAEAKLDEAPVDTGVSENYPASTDCFRVTIPFQTSHQKVRSEQGRCAFEASVVSPPARLVVAVSERVGGFEEDPNIQMRMLDPNKYIPQTIQSSVYSTVVSFREAESVVVYVEHKPYIASFAISSMLQSERLDMELVRKMVDSFVFTQ